MIQCIVCEDWYHSLHLDTEPTAAQDFCEMVCGPCIARLEFLKDYSGLCVTAVTDATADESALLNVTANTTVHEDKVEDKNEATPTKDAEGSKEAAVAEPSKDEDSSAPEAKKQKLDDSVAAPSSSTSSTEPVVVVMCRRPKKSLGSYEKGGTFWPDNWRDQLCTCAQCRSMYRQLGVEYLVDNEDTVKWYESVGMKKLAAKESDYDRGMRQLSSLDRVRQIDAITAYNKMKDRLKDYLNQFVANQQVVTEGDIKRFFAQMKNEDQKDLLVHSDIPFNCR